MYDVFEKLLKEKNVTASDVSKATGIPRSSFTDWKKGRATPKIDKLQKIADFFGVPLEVFTAKRKKKITAVFHVQNSARKNQNCAPSYSTIDLFAKPKISFDTDKFVKSVVEALNRDGLESFIDVSKYEMPQEEILLLERYHAADPGTQAAVRKLLDIPDSELPDNDLLPIAAHAEEGATKKDLESDVAILREHTEKK